MNYFACFIVRASNNPSIKSLDSEVKQSDFLHFCEIHMKVIFELFDLVFFNK